MTDILEEIDDVLTDWYGSADSMHWSPEPEKVDASGWRNDGYHTWIDETHTWTDEQADHIHLMLAGALPPAVLVQPSREGPAAFIRRYILDRLAETVSCCPPMQLGCDRCCPPREIQAPNPQAHLDIHKRRGRK